MCTWGILVVAVPVYMANRFAAGTWESFAGLVWAGAGLAGAIGSLAAGQLRLLGREVIVVTVCMMLTAVVTWPVAAVFGVAGLCVGLALVGLLAGPIDVALLTLRQRRTEPALLGRILAVSMSVNLVGFPIGTALGGGVLAAWSPFRRRSLPRRWPLSSARWPRPGSFPWMNDEGIQPLLRTVTGAHAGLPQRAQCRRPVPLGEAPPRGIRQQPVVRVNRRRPAHQCLQQPMQMRGMFQVLTAGHQSDAFPRVVMGDAKMVAGGRVLARQHHVAEPGRISEDGALAFLLERQAFDQSARHIEAQRMRFIRPRGSFRRRTDARQMPG